MRMHTFRGGHKSDVSLLPYPTTCKILKHIDSQAITWIPFHKMHTLGHGHSYSSGSSVLFSFIYTTHWYCTNALKSWIMNHDSWKYHIIPKCQHHYLQLTKTYLCIYILRVAYILHVKFSVDVLCCNVCTVKCLPHYCRRRQCSHMCIHIHSSHSLEPGEKSMTMNWNKLRLNCRRISFIAFNRILRHLWQIHVRNTRQQSQPEP